MFFHVYEFVVVCLSPLALPTRQRQQVSLHVHWVLGGGRGGPGGEGRREGRGKEEEGQEGRGGEEEECYEAQISGVPFTSE